jgi:hypothetical protein
VTKEGGTSSRSPCQGSGSVRRSGQRRGANLIRCWSYDRRAMKNKLTIVGPGGSMAKISRSLAALVSALEGAAGAGGRQGSSTSASSTCPCATPNGLQLNTLGEEVVRVAEKFASEQTLHREAECARAAERVASAAATRRLWPPAS